MDIYLVRHADALPQGVNNIHSDEERPLSEIGWKQAAQLGKALKKMGVVLDTLLCSPLVRAQQTALQLRTVLELPESAIETRDELAPGGRPKKVARCMNGLPGASIGLVGHLPDVGIYAGWLLGNKELAIQFDKCGAALIHVEGAIAKGAGTLIWLITPQWAG
jgi:phosphohistidine phosphatase